MIGVKIYSVLCFRVQPMINSMGPCDAIWRHRSGSTLAQAMAWCLTVPSYYLNQCWQIASEALCHSYNGRAISQNLLVMSLKITYFILFPDLTGHWVNKCLYKAAYESVTGWLWYEKRKNFYLTSQKQEIPLFCPLFYQQIEDPLYAIYISMSAGHNSFDFGCNWRAGNRQIGFATDNLLIGVQ